MIINGVKFLNRIVISPMCQYMAKKGCPTEWHYHHLRNLLETGAGSLVIESTAVSQAGRITKKDLCLYNNNHFQSHKKLVSHLKKIKKIPIILQISHSGRKGSAEIPWIKKNQSLKSKDKWETMAPSALARTKSWPIPKVMSKIEIKKVINQFVATAKLAFKAGYDGVEVHMANGYLVHQFCSPISNIRQDEYGVSSYKYKFPKEIIKYINAIKPKNKIIGARVVGHDHLLNGIESNDCIDLLKILKKEGLDYACISSGGILPKTNIKFFSGFRIEMAKKIKKESGLIIRTSGLIDNFLILNKILKKNSIDLVAIGRKFINDKFFLYRYNNIYRNNKIKIQNELKQYKYCI
jgi:2,4-dienoyl-CoA reductase-like NADH-dependent reductase (Old Yellow Enzyme family)